MNEKIIYIISVLIVVIIILVSRLYYTKKQKNKLMLKMVRELGNDIDYVTIIRLKSHGEFYYYAISNNKKAVCVLSCCESEVIKCDKLFNEIADTIPYSAYCSFNNKEFKDLDDLKEYSKTRITGPNNDVLSYHFMMSRDCW